MRQHDVIIASAVNAAVQVNPDVWDPHVSDTGVNPESNPG